MKAHLSKKTSLTSCACYKEQECLRTANCLHQNSSSSLTRAVKFHYSRIEMRGRKIKTGKIPRSILYTIPRCMYNVYVQQVLCFDKLKVHHICDSLKYFYLRAYTLP